MLKTQTSPFAVGRGTPWPFRWTRTRSDRADLRNAAHNLLNSSAVGSSNCLYLALDCHLSYCACNAAPIVSRAFCLEGPANGSSQHSRRARVPASVQVSQHDSIERLARRARLSALRRGAHRTRSRSRESTWRWSVTRSCTSGDMCSWCSWRCASRLVRARRRDATRARGRRSFERLGARDVARDGRGDRRG